MSDTSESKSPKVEAPSAFLSYSYDDTDHEVWVQELASRLQMYGVKVFFDKWDADLGSDLPHFMEKISVADYVIIVCTPNYAKKADERAGGVGAETSIVSAQVYKDINQNRALPIIRNGSPEDSLPTYLKSKRYLDWRVDDKRDNCLEELLRIIHKSPKTTPPELGVNPFAAGHEERPIEFVPTKRIIATEEQDRKVRSELWPYSAPLWSSILDKKIVIFYGTFPKEQNRGIDVPAANILKQFIQDNSSSDVEIVWWKDLGKYIGSANTAFISLGGDVSNPYSEALPGSRFSAFLNGGKPVTKNIHNNKQYESERSSGEWTEYLVLKSGQLNGSPAFYICGNHHYSNLILSRSIISETGYKSVLDEDEITFTAPLAKDWLFELEMNNEEARRINLLSSYDYLTETIVRGSE